MHAAGQGYLKTDGINIVNENGDPVILRGMGLGGWMLQEGYMMQTSEFANAQYQLREKIEELIGPDDTEAFYEAWLNNHVRKIDIDSLKAWGFNSVRLPMHYNLFTLPVEDEPVPGQHTWLQKGFELTDSLISWCRHNEMYVILDLHAAPGGQGYDQGISDYDPDKPSLWESSANRDKTVALWKRLAERYVGEPWIGGYDLINETNWNMSGNTPLRDLLKEITDSIRKVDSLHILFIEGNWFANDFTGLTPPWDNNMVYSPHKYWSVNDQSSIQWVLDMRDTHNVPIYFGEAGENSNVWFRDAIRLLEENQIGWAWWPLKKIESIAGPLSAVKTAGYQDLLDYWSGNGTRPSATEAKNALMQMAAGMRLENCTFHKDVIDAMFRQVTSDEAIPYAIQEIPGVVYPTDFDMGVIGSAYFDSDAANYQVTTGNYTSWNNGWVYRNDAVDIEVSQDAVNSNGYNVGWIATGEWMQYSIDVEEDALYDVEVRIASTGTEGKFHFQSGTADITGVINGPSTGGWQNWQTVTVKDVVLSMNDRKLRFYADQEGFNLGSFKFIRQGATTSLATTFLSAFTIDDRTIQLNLNKPIEGPLPEMPAGFTIFINGNAVTITEAELEQENPRTITISVGTGIRSTDLLRVSYSGTQIMAKDGTVLNTFSNRSVVNRVAIIHAIPGKIEAEDFFFQSGMVLENTTDTGGGENIGYLDAGDFADYYINVSQAGIYSVDYRTASLSETGGVKLEILESGGNPSLLHEVSFPSTGGWQSWTTTSENLTLPAGQQHLKMTITKPLFNLNWLEFTFVSVSSVYPPDQLTRWTIIPNPSDGCFTLNGSFAERQKLVYQVFTSTGKLILSQELPEKTSIAEKIDLSGYSEGIYLLVLHPEKEPAQAIKLIRTD
jgi:aryl-phospho-beta-D-glucosidase BglC (GH1 family)